MNAVHSQRYYRRIYNSRALYLSWELKMNAGHSQTWSYGEVHSYRALYLS